MKILVICQYYKPEPFRIADVCEELVKQGHEVTVVTGVPNYPKGEIYPGYEHAAGQDFVDNGVRIHRCYTVPRKQGTLYRMLNYISFAMSSTCYVRRIRDEYDVVLVNQLSPVMMAYAGLRYARKHRKKTVLYCLDLWPESLTAGGISKESLVYRVFERISRAIYRKADCIAITSRGFAPYLKTLIGEDKQIIHLPQYAEELFDEVPRWQPHDGPYHLVFAGNIGNIQSVDTIIQAAKLLEDDSRVVFDIVGDGSASDECKVMAEGMKNVVFHGRKTLEEMPVYYAMADAMIVSLKNNPTISMTLPGKVQSYMAAGRTVVGSIGGETELLIRDAQCGICAPPENAEVLARDIRELADHPDRFALYGENARKHYENYFTRKAFMDNLIFLLQNNIHQ